MESLFTKHLRINQNKRKDTLEELRETKLLIARHGGFVIPNPLVISERSHPINFSEHIQVLLA